MALKLHLLVRVAGSPVLVDSPFASITGRLDATELDRAGVLVGACSVARRPEPVATLALCRR